MRRSIPGENKPPEAVRRQDVIERDKEGEIKAQSWTEEGTCICHAPTSHMVPTHAHE